MTALMDAPVIERAGSRPITTTGVDPASRIARIEELLETAVFREDVSDGVGLSWAGLKTWLYRQHQGALGDRLTALPLRAQKPVTEKPCKNCGQTMSRREGETSSNWVKRSTCNSRCGAELTARRRRAARRRSAYSDGAVRATNRIQIKEGLRPGVHIVHHESGAMVTCSRCKYGFPRRTAKAAKRAKALHLRVNCLEPSV